jgi:hypothetical protein
MKSIDTSYQVLYSELAQRSLDAAFSTDFSIEGRFIRQEASGRFYWYFDTAEEGGKKKRRYVGPVDDEAITRRVEQFKDLKSDYRARRKLVSTLIREAYLPAPPQKVGDVVEALANAGFFRLRGVLVGTVAFQCYSASLGIRLPNTALQTGDADFAQFHSISMTVGDTTPDMLQVLQSIDATFRPLPHLSSPIATKFVARDGYKVEFLTPNTGSDDHQGKATMLALGSAGAEPLRFLDFLIYEPVRAVLLHNAGVPVLVPAPERYAVHKLSVASRREADRDATAKRRKDRQQAQILMEAMAATNQAVALADAYIEAWNRGAAWRDALSRSFAAMNPQTVASIFQALARGVKTLGQDPAMFDLPG